MGTHGSANRRQNLRNLPAIWCGASDPRSLPERSDPRSWRSLASAHLGTLSHRSLSLVLVAYSTSLPPTQCAPRRTCTQPRRQSKSDQSRPHASLLRRPSAASQSTTGSHGCPMTPSSVARSSSAVSTGRRTTGFGGSSTPCVTSQTRSW